MLQARSRTTQHRGARREESNLAWRLPDPVSRRLYAGTSLPTAATGRDPAVAGDAAVVGDTAAVGDACRRFRGLTCSSRAGRCGAQCRADRLARILYRSKTADTDRTGAAAQL